MLNNYQLSIFIFMCLKNVSDNVKCKLAHELATTPWKEGKGREDLKELKKGWTH